MGYRTVVMLYNDQAGQWTNDPELGRKIQHKMNFGMPLETRHQDVDFGYGHVVHCQHADSQDIGIFDNYRYVRLGNSAWRPNEATTDMQVRLLKEAAERLGYRLVKRPA